MSDIVTGEIAKHDGGYQQVLKRYPKAVCVEYRRRFSVYNGLIWLGSGWTASLAWADAARNV